MYLVKEGGELSVVPGEVGGELSVVHGEHHEAKKEAYQHAESPCAQIQPKKQKLALVRFKY